MLTVRRIVSSPRAPKYLHKKWCHVTCCDFGIPPGHQSICDHKSSQHSAHITRITTLHSFLDDHNMSHDTSSSHYIMYHDVAKTTTSALATKYSQSGCKTHGGCSKEHRVQSPDGTRRCGIRVRGGVASPALHVCMGICETAG